MLRGDGLTSTSLRVLTGDIISVQVRAHWVLGAHDDLAALSGAEDAYTGITADRIDTQVARAQEMLRPAETESLLIREVLLTGGRQRVWGASTVVAVLDRLPEQIVASLAATDRPIGPALHESGVLTTREIRQWGLVPAGRWAGILAGLWSPEEQIPSRDYLMRAANDGCPLAHFVEWFSPAVFESRRDR
ncbi:chorismate pyruvate-lyase family protein [Nocardioides alcanivorans]|uniref:chorismate pyruvate-lyase family protein n=1 Tax=Nocardioides alcanivorans TaxID=2897352 RepID=UPI001F3DDD76|nr:chorismate pyruvate-lyase family protein [Nocardioides alcanivorans]